jgi:hypothetical protein
MLTSDTETTQGTVIAALFFTGVILCSASISFAASEAAVTLPDWISIMDAHHDALVQVRSDQAALDVFATGIGRAAALNDVVATLSVKGIPPKLSKELMVSEITQSAQRLVAALVAWHAAERMLRSLEQQHPDEDVVIDSSQAAWIMTQGTFPSLNAALRSWEDRQRSAASGPAAGRAALESGQRAMEEWWRLKTWKDRVRSVRGQTRLCGTWQWVIHNHQRHHEEQKLSIVFPPPGTGGTGITGLTESIVLGDVVYLRWEIDGRVQEDSLLFSKEGQRLEGTFVNSQGGWGSITGKRTASCPP